MSTGTTARGIEVRGEQVLVTWEDGHETTFSARDLRLNCSCAECVEEWSHRKLLDPANVPPNMAAEDYLMVGRYAVQFLWSDGHSTGIFPFEMLRALCGCEECEAKRQARAQ